MEKFLSTRRSQDRVMPTGVKVTMRSLTGQHQALITQDDDVKRKTAIDEMILDCIVRIGDKTDIQMSDVEGLLSNDRAWFLFQLRIFSNKQSPDFLFDYEFPVDKGGKRRKQRYKVLFNKEDFPARPYYWVWEKMCSDYRDANEMKATQELTESDLDILHNQEYPEMFQMYSEMLAKYQKQELVLPDSEVKIQWTMTTGLSERLHSERKGNATRSSHDQLLLHNPKYWDDDATKTWETAPILPLNKLSNDDIEALREDIMKKEASIETSVVIQYKEQESVQANVNLITIPSFFFPSLAR